MLFFDIIILIGGNFMKKSSILLLVISITGLLLGNIASFLAISKLYNNDFNILHIVNDFNFSNLSFVTLIAVLVATFICVLIHLIFVCIRKKPKHLVFTFLVLIGGICSAYTLPFTVIKTVDFLGNIEANKSDSNIVNAIACIGTALCLILALISLALSILCMSEKKKEVKVALAKTNSETIILGSSKDENLIVAEEKKAEADVSKKEEVLKDETVETKVESKEEINEETKEELNKDTIKEEKEAKNAEEKKEESIVKEEKPVAPKKKAPAKKKTTTSKDVTDKKGTEVMEKTTTEKEEKKASTAKAYHVVKRKEDNKWTVKLANGDKVIKTFATKEEALAYSKGLAERQNGTLRVHASKGKSKGKIQKQ